MEDKPLTDTTSQPSPQVAEAGDAFTRALREIRTPEDAERVLDALERDRDGATELDAHLTPPAPGSTPPQTVLDAASGEPGCDKAASVLAAAVEQTTGAVEPDAVELADTLHDVMTRPVGDRLKPRGFLQAAALHRMTPLQAWDASLYIAVNRLPRPGYATRFMSGTSTVAMHGAGWIAYALLIALRDRKDGRRTAAEVIPVVVITDTLVERVLKVYFRRRRPFITLVQALVVGRKPGSWSFPSGHSAISFASASVLGHRYKRRRPVLYLAASLVAFSRVYLGHHYPLDVVSGATAGVGVSRCVTWTLSRLRRR